jgi:hypothetical protein
MQELFVVWLAPLPSFGETKKPAIHTVIEGPEDPVEALLDGEEIAAIPRGPMQLEKIREQPRLRIFVAGAEPAINRV